MAVTVLFSVAALVTLGLTGAGLAVRLAPRLPLDAQMALAAPLGAAVFACASASLHLGVPVRLSGAAVVVLFGGLTVASLRRVGPAARRAGKPLLVAIFVMAVVAVPNLARGTGQPSTFGNPDPYLWVSQARSLLDGPPPGPVADHPDRLAYERLMHHHWPTALPYGLAGMSALDNRDPVDSYGAFTAVIAALLSLAVFVCARACLGWNPRNSTAAALVFGVNATILYASFIGWQAQLLLTTFGFLAAVMLRLVLDAGASWREEALCGLFAAAAVAAYGWTSSAFAALLGAVVAGFWLSRRHEVSWRTIAGRCISVGAWFLALGAIPFAEVLLKLGDLARFGVTAGPVDGAPPGLPAGALGLVPRMGDLDRPSAIWTGLAVGVGTSILVLPLLRKHRSSIERSDFLLASTFFVVGAGAVLAVGASSYFSIKLMGYGAPFLVLFAMSAVFSPALTKLEEGVVAAAIVLACASTLFVFGEAFAAGYTPQALAPLRAAAARVPAGARIRLRVGPSVEQLWALYFLRDHKVTIDQPVNFLTGLGLRIPSKTYQHGGARYVLTSPVVGRILWRGSDGISLQRLDHTDATLAAERPHTTASRGAEVDNANP